MNDLTPHQRDILIAMLQGKRIESMRFLKWVPIDIDNGLFHELQIAPIALRIAPNQDEAVRLYGDQINSDLAVWVTHKYEFHTHYIDISPNGFIVGSKIEDV